ncbi:putative protein KIAA1522 like [Dissostichus eleginoides]|uniref:KIAA1522 n=1 Tax=Dissostichus eleginoides TaxID=100907 RepID=A0AAD9BDC9_DISEL|nr:putative protein KIAA1522 like [Dissostichus eleginoides]
MVVSLRKSLHSLLSVFKKKAGPKGNEEQKRLTVHYSTSQHYQENVFIEGSRPQYLEDLHTEAQEGLKIQQQEEHPNGLNLPDNESIAVNTLRPEQDISSKDDGGSPESRSTTGSTDTTVTSAVSTRPVLTRQGSTFKPLNPVKRLDKSRKRGRRTTIMGIPNQVQKELALHRSFQQLVSTPNHDGNLSNSQSGVVIIPTVDGGTPEAKTEGARVHLSELEASRDEQLLRKQLQAIYQDEQPFNHQGLGSYLCPNSSMRPKSLAVPGMTTSSSFCPSTMLSFLQERQGPVMSMSPQATYMSTIIPNAVLPSSIDVIEIDRSSSRTRGGSVNHGSSVRTVSKSSLASGDLSVSPFLSRRSDGDGSQSDNSQSESTLMLTSASGLNWSETQSSKIIISNSSPGSSKGSTRSSNSHRVGPNGRESQAEQCNGDQDIDSLRSSVSMISSFGSKRENITGQESESDVSGSVATGDDAKIKQNCTRSLSVMKTKQPPPPPRRTNSLHSNKIKSNSNVLVEINDSDGANATENSIAQDENKSVKLQNSTGSSCLDASSSPLNPTQASSTGGSTEPEHSSYSPQKTPSEGGKFERTMSPSSGYSSQSGTPTLTPKGISPTPPDKQKKKPVKPERSVSRASSSAASPCSSLTSLSSGTSEPVNPDVSTCSSSLPSQGSQPTVAADELTPNNISSTFAAEVRELLKIPPPPRVKAPGPPPPEAWVHNNRTFQLLCGPNPNVSKVTQNPAQKQDSTVKQAGTQTEDIKEIPDSVEKQSTICQSVLESQVKPEILLETSSEGLNKEMENRECPNNKQEEILVSSDVPKQEQSSNLVVKDPKSPKKEPPPVMKKPVTVLHKEEWVKKESVASSAVNLPVENHTTTSQHGVVIVVDKSDNEMAKSEVASVEVPKITKVSPPPSPPPAYHPTPPLSRKTPPSSVSSPPDDLQRVQEEIHVVESCWPPPPPPMDGDSVFDGGDDVDFPPPPPPLVTESLTNVMDSCVTDLGETKTQTEEDKETIDDSSEANTSAHGQIADVPPAVPQTVTDIVPDSLKRDSPKLEDQSPNEAPVSAQLPVIVPVAPPLPAESLTQGVNFRRQPGLPNRDTRSKELLSRHKSALIPKEDANIPLVTPSLLQMVRLRSVNMTEDVVKAEGEDKTTNQGASVQDNCPVSVTGAQNIPQKPIRKSLSLKSPPQSVKTSSVAPSMRLQEAIRMKTAAMSSRGGLPSRLGVRSTYSSLGEHGALSLKSPEGSEMLKTPASTVSDQSKATVFSNGGVKLDRAPPPVAKKPASGSISPPPSAPAGSAKTDFSVEGNGAIGAVQHTSGVTHPEMTTTRVTADTIETLF